MRMYSIIVYTQATIMCAWDYQHCYQKMHLIPLCIAIPGRPHETILSQNTSTPVSVRPSVYALLYRVHQHSTKLSVCSHEAMHIATDISAFIQST